MKTEQDLNNTIEQYADTIKRICMTYLKNTDDTDDIFQNVFFKYYKSSVSFESEEHKKAWLIRITINECKDMLKNFFRKTTSSLEAAYQIPSNTPLDEHASIRACVFSLPEKYRIVIFLYYFEGYSAVEISKILSKNVNSIYTLLSRGKAQLKLKLGGEENEW